MVNQLSTNEKNTQNFHDRKNDFFITYADPHMNKKLFNEGILNT